MTTAAPPTRDEDVKQALEDLVSSPGWAIFCDYARSVHGPDAVAADLMSVGTQNLDLNALGAVTAARLSVLKAVEQLIFWPPAILEQYRTAAKEPE